jgi:hypothetical protein
MSAIAKFYAVPVRKRILKKENAYAIMPLGKKRDYVHGGQKNESPNRTAIQLGDSSCLFRVVKPSTRLFVALTSAI